MVIDAPHANGNSGGGVAAPIFRRIAEPALRYLGVAPTINPAPPVLVPPRTIDASAAGPSVRSGPAIDLVSDTAQRTMPDLRGMSAREAMRTLLKLGLTARMSGTGFVLSQDPPPGSPFEEGDACRVELGKAALAPAAEVEP